MRKIVYSILVVVFAWPAAAQQSLDTILQELVKNNVGFHVRQSLAETRKLENRLGNMPNNPEVEGGYLWGSPSAIGNRKDFSISQEIAFPTVYYHRKKLADLRDLQADLNVDQYRLALKQEVVQLWVELVSLNQRIAIQQDRTNLAEKLSIAYQERLNAGDVNRIDYNKAALNFMQKEKELAVLQQEKELLQLSLNGLNGNQPVVVEQKHFEEVNLPTDFEQWAKLVMQANPQALWYTLEADAAEREIKLKSSEKLPEINGGYMMENTVGEKFQGVTVGLSIPLWENKNSVRIARMRLESNQLEEKDFQFRFKTELRKHYRSLHLASVRVKELREGLGGINQQDLLKEALDSGQISLIEYLLEMQFNYEAIDQVLDAEKELQLNWQIMKVLGE